MDRDTFSHIRLWCPRPFGTYSQNKPRGGAGGAGGGGTGAPLCKAEAPSDPREEQEEEEEDAGSENTPPDPAALPAANPPAPAAVPAPPPSPGVKMEDGRVLLDTWYVIKPGNTKEKIAFFVAHQCSPTGLPRPSAMKVKGNWATDCTKAKRRRRCSSYEPPGRPREPAPPPEDAASAAETDLLSVAEMVALVEQRTAMALQGIVGQAPPPSADHAPQTGSDPADPAGVFLSEPTASAPPRPPSPDDGPEQREEEEELRRVAETVALFEQQQQLEAGLLRAGDGGPPAVGRGEGERPPPGGGDGHARGEVRIAFRVSSLDPRAQSEPAGRPSCMFMSCGGGGGQAGARAKEKITCDLYQLVSPSSRDPGGGLLLASSPKSDPRSGAGEGAPERPAGGSAPGSSDPAQEPGAGDKKAASGRERERVTGFHVEVVVTGAVDQCVFYGKDSTENVQEETVCFAMSDAGEDPPPGQLFFLQAPRPEEDSLDCANNNGPAGGGGGATERPASPTGCCTGGGGGGAGDERAADPSLCRLYRHVSHDFLEIRFQIQRLLEPRQYMLLLPDHIMVNIFGYLPTRSLAALKCTCHDFKALIETYGVRATDSQWNQDPLYRDDPCKQCKRQYARGDVSLCRWHPKPYHHDLPYGRSYWMCCRRTDKDTPGCRVGLHDNNWVQPCELVQTRARREDGR